MYFSIILLIVIFFIISYKIESFSCKYESPYNMWILNASNDEKNINKFYKPKRDIMHKSNPYFYLILAIDKLWQPKKINLDKANVQSISYNDDIINITAKEILKKINELVKLDAKINKRIYKCRIKSTKILPPTVFEIYKITNKVAYKIIDRIYNENKIYTIFSITLRNRKNKFSDYLILNIHVINKDENKIGTIIKVDYLSLKSTDSFFLKPYYNNINNKYRNFETTNKDDMLLPEFWENPELQLKYGENDRYTKKKLKKILDKNELSLLNKINKFTEKKSGYQKFQEFDLAKQKENKKKLQKIYEKEIENILEESNINNNINETIDENIDVNIDENIDETIDENIDVNIDENIDVNIDENIDVNIDENIDVNNKIDFTFKKKNLSKQEKRKINQSKKKLEKLKKKKEISYKNYINNINNKN